MHGIFRHRRHPRVCLRPCPGAFDIQVLERRVLLAGDAPAAGHRDATFGTDGIVTTNLAPPHDATQDELTDLAVAPDGKIVAAGITDTSFGVVRYNADGTPDASFGSGGAVTLLNTGYIGYRVLTVVQDDGKVIVGGPYTVVRLNADGTQDAAFHGFNDIGVRGVTGTVTVTTLALDADGRIVGTARGTNGVAVFRLNPDGTFDPTFGGDGVVTGLGIVVNSIVAEDDGQVLVAGTDLYPGTTGPDHPKWAIARLNEDGSRDASFGTGGVVIDDFGAAPYGGYDAAIQDIAALPGGGYAVVGAGVAGGINSPPALDVARYSDAGVRDTAWGGQPRGMVTIPELYGLGSRIGADAAGRVYVASAERAVFSRPTYVATARVLPGGTLDPAWGRSGVARTYIGGARVGALRFQRDGKLLTGGAVPDHNGLSDFWLVRQETAELPPAAPVAMPGGPYVAPEGVPLRLDGSASFDVDGTVANYEWDLDYDGVTFTADATGAVATLPAAVIDGPGGRTVALRVTDDEGQSSVSSTPVTFVNAPPALRIGGSHVPDEGWPYVLDLSATNVGPDAVTHWTIDWGDGSAPEVVAGAATSATHVYADGPATHRIRATATDEDGTYDAGFVGLDRLFGTNGVVSQLTQSSVAATAAAQQPDGKVLLYDGSDLRRIARSGGPDIAFGRSGVGYDPVTRVTALLPAPDGKILGVGYMGSVFRLNADGTPDTGFGPERTGRVVGRMGYQREQTHTLALQPDGRIVVAGGGIGDDFTLHRLNPDGSNDNSFGTSGVTGVKFTSWSTGAGAVNALLILPDGRMLAGGNAPLARPQYPPADMGQTRFALAQFNPDGSLDPTFGDGGKVIFNFPFPEAEGGVVNRMARLPDGKILALGTVRLHYYEGTGQWRTRVGLARFNPDGTPDTTFGTGGAVLAPFPGETHRAGGLAVAPDGRILVSTSTGLNVARFNPDGTLDTTFGTGGRFGADVQPNWAETFPNLFLQDDGDLLFAGTSNYYILAAEVNVLETVTVRNAWPTLTLGGNPAAAAGVPYTLRPGADDPGADTIRSWHIDWGDGTSETFQGQSPPATHTYAAAGSYAVTATATDEDGSYTATRTLHVMPVPALAAEGTLSVVGTPADDAIDVGSGGGVIRVAAAGHAWEFDAAAVLRLNVTALAGNDVLTLADGLPGGAIDLGDGHDRVSFAGPVPAGTALVGGGGTDHVDLLQDGPAGDDVIEVTRAQVLVNGAAAVAYTSVEGVSIKGGAGNDTFLPQAAMDLVFDGGAGDDSLTWAGPTGNGGFFNLGLTEVGEPWLQGSGPTTMRCPGVESVLLQGGSGTDTFTVRAVPAGTRLTLRGGEGGDNFTFGVVAPVARIPLGPFAGTVVLEAGGGADTMTFGMADTYPAGGTYDFSTTAVSLPGGTVVTYTGVETAALEAGNGPDVVRVTPSAETLFNLAGRLPSGIPSGSPIDRLEIRPEGATGATIRLLGGGNNLYEFSNRQRVIFSGFEQVTDLVPPRVTDVRYTPGLGALFVTFSENVRGGVGVEDLSVVDVARGRRYTPSEVTFPNGAPVARFQFDGLPPGVYEATVSGAGVSDPAGNVLGADHVARFIAPGMAGRHVFYNRSAFDGNDPAADARDDAAVAPDKAPLLPGQAPGFANVTSFGRGLNGVMIDAFGLGSLIDETDFEFHVAAAPSATWAEAPRPVTVTRRAGAGVNGSDRVTILWPDGAIRNQWLQVTVLATSRTGLLAPDVFSFGNLIGESGDGGAGLPAVTVRDLLDVRARSVVTRGPQGPGSRWDVNRDGRVNALDVALVRANLAQALAAPPADGPAAAAALRSPSALDEQRPDPLA